MIPEQEQAGVEERIKSVTFTREDGFTIVLKEGFTNDATGSRVIHSDSLKVFKPLIKQKSAHDFTGLFTLNHYTGYNRKSPENTGFSRLFVLLCES